MSWSAYVDESEPDPGAYVLAAALIPAGLRDEVRTAVAALRWRGQRKLHWHAENDQRRKLLTAAVAELEALYVVVVRVERTESSERRRRLCLRRLLCDLDEAGVGEVCLEAREAKQNQRDLQLLRALRAEKAISPAIRMAHPAGPLEPLLWIPDLVAGAVGAARQGRRGYLDQLSGQVTILGT